MKSFVSKLKERIVLLENNSDIENMTSKRYKEALSTRAYIRILKSDEMSELCEVILPKLPVNLKLNITGIKWYENEYSINTLFSEYKNRFIKGKFIRYLCH